MLVKGRKVRFVYRFEVLVVYFSGSIVFIIKKIFIKYWINEWKDIRKSKCFLKLGIFRSVECLIV